MKWQEKKRGTDSEVGVGQAGSRVGVDKRSFPLLVLGRFLGRSYDAPRLLGRDGLAGYAGFALLGAGLGAIVRVMRGGRFGLVFGLGRGWLSCGYLDCFICCFLVRTRWGHLLRDGFDGAVDRHVDDALGRRGERAARQLLCHGDCATGDCLKGFKQVDLQRNMKIAGGMTSHTHHN